MIKKTLLLISLLVPLMVTAQDKKWSVYPSAGVDMGGAIPFPFKNIPEGAKGTPELYPALGIGYRYCFNDKWDLSLEVNYHILAFTAIADVRSQPFYYNNRQDTMFFSGHTETDVELRFVEFPLVAGYSVNQSWTITSGIYYSRVLEGSFVTEGSKGVISPDKSITDTATLPGNAPAYNDFNDCLDKWDAGLLLGFRYDMTPMVSLWSRFHVGLKSIFRSDFDYLDYEMYQARFNIGVSVNLIGKK